MNTNTKHVIKDKSVTVRPCQHKTNYTEQAKPINQHSNLSLEVRYVWQNNKRIYSINSITPTLKPTRPVVHHSFGTVVSTQVKVTTIKSIRTLKVSSKP